MSTAGLDAAEVADEVTTATAAPAKYPLLDAAHELVSMGFAIFAPQHNGKVPRNKTNGFKDAKREITNDSLFMGPRACNIGIATEGLCVLDVDVKDGPNQWFDCLSEGLRSDLFAAPHAKTHSGGWHFYFRPPEGLTLVCSAGTIAKGIDIRANGGYVIAPPSTINGNMYSWAKKPDSVNSLPIAPQWLLDAIEAAERRPGGCGGANVANSQHHGPPSQGDVIERAKAYLAKLPDAIQGQDGSGKLYTAATALVHGFCLSGDEALTLLAKHYNPRCVPPWSEKELLHKISDAATKPHDRPYGWLRDEPQKPSKSKGGKPSGSKNKPAGGPKKTPNLVARLSGRERIEHLAFVAENLQPKESGEWPLLAAHEAALWLRRRRGIFLHQSDAWHVYIDGVYTPGEDDRAAKSATLHLVARDHKPTATNTRDLLHNARALADLPTGDEPPHWVSLLLIFAPKKEEL